MTEVAFHFNAPDKLGYACRLVRKALGSAAQVVVTGEEDLLGQLDVALWTFQPLEFIPHCREPGAPAAVLQASPVVLTGAPRSAPHHHVLVNLGEPVPDGFEAFERLIEVVTPDDEDRQQARQRWKHYAARGYNITRHDLRVAVQ
jgi:DNA polymerase III subunit chi